jgi:hypothetical protein
MQVVMVHGSWFKSDSYYYPDRDQMVAFVSIFYDLNAFHKSNSLLYNLAKWPSTITCKDDCKAKLVCYLSVRGQNLNYLVVDLSAHTTDAGVKRYLSSYY